MLGGHVCRRASLLGEGMSVPAEAAGHFFVAEHGHDRSGEVGRIARHME